MRMLRFASALLVLTTACNSSDPAEGQATAGARSAAYNIAGVRIGMTLDEARRVLESKGFKTEVTMKGHSFEEKVAEEIAKVRRTGFAQSNTAGAVEVTARKPGEQVVVSVAPGPNGGSIKHVSYFPEPTGRSVEELRAQMIKRYGQPTQTVQNVMLWCAASDPCDWRRNAKPSLSYNGVSLSLEPGAEAKAAAKATLDAAVRAKVGNPTSSF